jgi:hypothetical protein
VELGTGRQISYENPEGKQVTITYRGMRDLNVIHGELEHGTELIYSEEIGMEEAAIQRCVSPRAELGVFAPIKRSQGPDYISKDVLEELRQKAPDLDWDEGTDDQSQPKPTNPLNPIAPTAHSDPDPAP